MVEPWYRETLAADRRRLAEIDALIAGSEYRPRDPGWEMSQALAAAAFKDAECFRGFVSNAMLLNRVADVAARPGGPDRKSTRLNSSHQIISYAVFCLKKKKQPPRHDAHAPPHVMLLILLTSVGTA